MSWFVPIKASTLVPNKQHIMAQNFRFSFRNILIWIVIPVALVAAWLIFHYVLGDPSNFVGDDPANEPLKGNYLGTIYKGGPVVVILITFQLILITYIVERLLSIAMAAGRQNNTAFVHTLKPLLNEAEVDEVEAACDRQRGSVANVIRNGMASLRMVLNDSKMSHEQKVLRMKKDLEEAIQLEIPQLNTNMVIISTLASISTLVGLLGTVTGMIKAFAALARVGAPDAVGLANGISQALVTTALGISTAVVAIVFYNYFANRIDKITYAMDESVFSILNSFKLSK